MPADLQAQLERVSALHDPVRRTLYLYVAGRPDAVGRDEAARAAGISRALAAFHLDRLAADGLLTVEYRRLTRRRGPGAGRPAKLYRRARAEIAITVPPRNYETAGRLLAHALAAEPAARGRATPCRTQLGREAHEAGAAMGATAATHGPARTAAIVGVLRRAGYEPVREPNGDIRLRNCPFDALAREQRELVCGMNLALLEGIVTGAGDTTHTAALDPRPGQCCVVLRKIRAKRPA